MSLKVCPLTGLPVMNLMDNGKEFYYDVIIRSNITYRFRFCSNCFEEIEFENYKGEILGILINTNKIKNPLIHWKKSEKAAPNSIFLKELIETADIPRTASEKLNHLLQNLFQHSQKNKRGYSKPLDFLTYGENYMSDTIEFKTYLDELVEAKLIKLNVYDAKTGLFGFTMTYKGIEHFDKISKGSSTSNKCFIAMAFTTETETIKDAIKNAVSASGFQPIIISDENIDSDKTIVDRIIAEIRDCRFCIADFTLHRNGVYFEAGFALGLSKQVIYCCRKDEFDLAHFDIKQLQHIIYDNPGELKAALENKIKAWIK